MRYTFLLILFAAAALAAAHALPLSAQAGKSAAEYREGVTVVHSANMAPMSFLGLNGEPKGFVIDFWRKWSEETGIPVTFKLINWKKGLELMKSGDCDIHGGLFVSDDRLDYLDYSESIFPLKAALFARKDSDASSIWDVGDRVVGVLDKGYGEEFMRRNHSRITIRPYQSVQEEATALINKEIDFAVMDYSTMRYLSGTLGAVRDLVVVEMLYEKELRVAVLKGNVELLGLVTAGMNSIDTAERDRIMGRWFLEEPPGFSTLKIVVILAVGALLLAIGGIFFGGSIRRK